MMRATCLLLTDRPRMRAPQLLLVVRLAVAAAAHWYPSQWARTNCATAGALAAADPTAAGSAIPGVALGVARGDTTLSAGASYTPGETLRLSVEG
eukprot:2154381-Prymnesium_polylepis.1